MRVPPVPGIGPDGGLAVLGAPEQVELRAGDGADGDRFAGAVGDEHRGPVGLAARDDETGLNGHDRYSFG
jgi:hypothetical protein